MPTRLEFPKTLQKCADYVRPKLLPSKEFIVGVILITHSFLSLGNYFLKGLFASNKKNSTKCRTSRSAKRKENCTRAICVYQDAVSREYAKRGEGERKARAFFTTPLFELPAGKILPRAAEICWMHAGQPGEIYCRPTLALRAEVGLSSRNSLLRTGTSRQLLTPRKVYFEKCTANAGFIRSQVENLSRHPRQQLM